MAIRGAGRRVARLIIWMRPSALRGISEYSIELENTMDDIESGALSLSLKGKVAVVMGGGAGIDRAPFCRGRSRCGGRESQSQESGGRV